MTLRRYTPIAAALLTTVLTGCTTSATDDPKTAPTTSVASSPAGAPGGTDGVSLIQAIDGIPTAAEHQGGYDRDDFKHWTAGADRDDGCDTREELLLVEAVTKPEQGEGCRLSGGTWLSYYDKVTVTNASELDVDHMVALEEAWSSGAWKWTPERREAFANDLAADRSLVAVTAKTNRSKGAKDPANWLPPAKSAQCTYAADWTATKLRWALTADQVERAALNEIAADCRDTTVSYQPAP